MAALLGEDTQGEHRRGDTTAAFSSQGFPEVAWVFSGWGETRQRDEGMAQQPEGCGQGATGLQHGADSK